MPTSASTVLLHEQAEPRTILEHQLAERDTTTQVLNSHTVDDKYTDHDGTVCPETKSQKYSDRDSQNDKYSPQNPKWQGNNNNNRGKFSYPSRGSRPCSRDANNCPRRDQGYGYQYSQPQRGSYRKRFGQGSWRGRSYARQTYGRGQPPHQNDNSMSGLGHPSYKGIPQHHYICSLCSNKRHYDHQCHYAQQIMNHATAVSIKAHQQKNAVYDYNNQQHQNQYQETYTVQNQQNDQQHNQPQNPNF